MRANGFKKALILAVAAFVTAVIGVEGAKLKVQAHTTWNIPSSVSNYDLSSEGLTNGDYIQNGVTFGCTANGYTIRYYSCDSTSLGSVFVNMGDHDVTLYDDGGKGDGWVVLSAVYGSTREIELGRPYKIEYKDGDGNVLQTSYEFDGLATPDYTGSDPTKTATAQYTYSWKTTDKWTPTVAATVSDNATYVAQFDSAVNTYTITWKNYDGSVLETDAAVAYGTLPTYDGATPSRPDDENYTYTFSRWEPTVQVVTGDATYTAVYLQDPKPATGGGSEPDSSSSSGDGSGSGDGTNGGANGGANGNRAPKTADTMPGIIVIALAGLLGGALLITGGRKASK